MSRFQCNKSNLFDVVVIEAEPVKIGCSFQFAPFSNIKGILLGIALWRLQTLRDQLDEGDDDISTIITLGKCFLPLSTGSYVAYTRIICVGNLIFAKVVGVWLKATCYFPTPSGFVNFHATLASEASEIGLADRVLLTKDVAM